MSCQRHSSAVVPPSSLLVLSVGGTVFTDESEGMLHHIPVHALTTFVSVAVAERAVLDLFSGAGTLNMRSCNCDFGVRSSNREQRRNGMKRSTSFFAIFLTRGGWSYATTQVHRKRQQAQYESPSVFERNSDAKPKWATCVCAFVS